MIFRGLWSSRRVGGLKHVPFRVYAGLLMLCDDVGLFEADAAVIHGLLFSTTPDIRLADVKSALDAIESAELVRFYEVRGKRFGCLWNYRQSKGLKRRRQECPSPPPEVLAWQSSTEIPRMTDPPDSDSDPASEQKGTEQNRTELNGTENAAVVPVSAELLVAYAWAHCGMGPRPPVKFTVSDARALLKNCQLSMAHNDSDLRRRERFAVSALEYMAGQDSRTRWQAGDGPVKNPVALLVSLTQDYRDGIGKKPQGRYVPFDTWLASKPEVTS